MKFATKLLHLGTETDPYTGAASVPIYQASTYHHESLDTPPPFEYARSGNPTRKALEDTIAQLENGVEGWAFASGMAAVSTVFMLLSSGDHLICTQDVYGGTYRVLTKVFARMNIATTFVDCTDMTAVADALRPNTKAIYLETPSNPTMRITDLRSVSKWGREKGLITIVDNTFMTPYLQRPLELGVDIVVHSATKFLGGHSDVLAGLVVTSDADLAPEIKGLQNALGGVLGPYDSWLVLRGLKTLQARLDVSQASAAKVAAWLAQRDDIANVYYPGLSTHPGATVHSGQSDGGGAVLSFDVGSGQRAKQVMEAVNLPLVAVSLGGVETILSYPALMSHSAVPRSLRMERGITDGLLRFSVGLEAPEDLIADLEQALTVE